MKDLSLCNCNLSQKLSIQKTTIESKGLYEVFEQKEQLYINGKGVDVYLKNPIGFGQRGSYARSIGSVLNEDTNNAEWDIFGTCKSEECLYHFNTFRSSDLSEEFNVFMEWTILNCFTILIPENYEKINPTSEAKIRYEWRPL